MAQKKNLKQYLYDLLLYIIAIDNSMFGGSYYQEDSLNKDKQSALIDHLINIAFLLGYLYKCYIYKCHSVLGGVHIHVTVLGGYMFMSQCVRRLHVHVTVC